MLRVLLHWVGHGIKFFRVDNPHTKPPDFWAWLIGQVKNVDPDVLSTGATLFHEHLNQHSADPNSRQKFLEDVDNMIDEVRGAGRAGISCIVDAGHEDMGRNIDELKRIAVANDGGVHIVGSGGYYLQRAYPPEIATRSEDQIADELVATAARQHLGAFGEIGQSAVMTPDEHKVFRAVGKAHLRTGLPIFTHNAYNGLRPDPSPPVARDSALRQLDIFESVGVKPQSVAIGHVCCLDDPKAEISIALAKRGAFVGFDRAYGEAIIPDAMRIAMAAKLIAMVRAMIANRPESANQSPPARSASSIVAVIDPGPAISGIANGKAAMLRMWSIAIASEAISLRRSALSANTMSKAM